MIRLGNLFLACSALIVGASNQEAIQCSKVSAKHILVDSESQANEILQNIRSGKMSFETAAKKSSKCPSGENGGDLGYFGRGMMVKEFEETAFAAVKGEIVGPIKTTFGWHLIKVVDKK
jgi:peptidyl-prolyl cis-trans isomerase C